MLYFREEDVEVGAGYSPGFTAPLSSVQSDCGKNEFPRLQMFSFRMQRDNQLSGENLRAKSSAALYHSNL